MINSRGSRAAVRGVFSVRGIRMRERAYNFSGNFRIEWGGRTVLH
jgi:hypothetical protein